MGKGSVGRLTETLFVCVFGEPPVIAFSFRADRGLAFSSAKTIKPQKLLGLSSAATHLNGSWRPANKNSVHDCKKNKTTPLTFWQSSLTFVRVRIRTILKAEAALVCAEPDPAALTALGVGGSPIELRCESGLGGAT
jgi:hypothetical protein